MTLAELSRKIENMIRIGTIHDVDHAARRVRVKSGNLHTEWLKWKCERAGSTRDWNPPTVGEQVMILSPSGELANGIVIPSIYSDAHDSPSGSAAEHVTAYPDGARVSYNHDSGALIASGIKTALVQASEQVTINCPETHVTGTLTVDGLLTYKGGMAGSGGGAAAAVIDGDVVIGGISFLGHGHPDPQGGDVGAPQ